MFITINRNYKEGCIMALRKHFLFLKFWIIFPIQFCFYFVIRLIGLLFPKIRYELYSKTGMWVFTSWLLGWRYYKNFHLLPNIPNLNKNSRVLYVGAEPYCKPHLDMISAYSNHITVTDINPDAARFAFGHPFSVADIKTIDKTFSENTFDIVIIVGVYYHYGNGDAFLDASIPAIANILQDKTGILITGTLEKSYSEKYTKIADSPTVNRYFEPATLSTSKYKEHHLHHIPFGFPSKNDAYQYEIFKNK